MAGWRESQWEPNWSAPSRRHRRGGAYRAYEPDVLVTRPLAVTPDLTRYAAEVETAIRRLASGDGARGLEGLARFLLRSEAIASSRIEGLRVSSQQVALAELAQTEDVKVRGFSENARLVANNITALRAAATSLAEASSVTVDDMLDLQRALLPDHLQLGLRKTQNWLGGSGWHPLDAEYVPPPEAAVPALMKDLSAYTSGAVHAPLVQAGLVHAQFETIHPFSDGNGRVGRALIHTVLTRRGLTRGAVLPVSLVLLTRSDEYVAGLTSYRYDGPPNSDEATRGASAWLTTFLRAVATAVEQAERFMLELDDLQSDWLRRHGDYRTRKGLRPRPRSTSAVARLLSSISELPLVTARTVQRHLGVSFPAARAAAEELADAGILHRRSVERGTTGYLALEIFDLLTFTERRLASTAWDARESQASRPIPALPERGSSKG